MDRRDFLTMSGIGIAGLMLPFGRSIAAEALLVPIDVARKKALADAALAAATAGRARPTATCASAATCASS